jgi:hypothetical protein
MKFLLQDYFIELKKKKISIRELANGYILYFLKERRAEFKKIELLLALKNMTSQHLIILMKFNLS